MARYYYAHFIEEKTKVQKDLRDFPKVTVLVLSGCGTTITKYPRFRNNANSLITVLEAEKSKLKALADSVSSETCFLIDGRLFTITS